MWTCVRCGERSEDSFDACWQCGVSRDGAEPAPEPPRDMDCIRCRVRLLPDGIQSFHDGANWAQIGGLSELTVEERRFERYRCPGCGRVELVAVP